MEAKITALIPTFRRPEYLRRAMQSVLGQTYKNLKISIFDNASGDNTENIVNFFKENDPRIIYHRHSTNIGALENFKYAFNSINTPYFSILGDDDFLAQDFYKKAIEVLDNHPNVMFVIFNTFRVDENTNLIWHKECSNKLTFYSGKDGFDEIHSGNIPQTWTGMVFRKEVGKIYHEMENINDIGSDMRFIFRAASRYDYAYLSKVGAFFTEHSNSGSSSIKSFDLVHQGIQISRYLEIYHDKNVSQEIKEGAVYQINKLLSLKPDLVHSIMKIMKNHIIQSDVTNKKIEENIDDYRKAGYIKSSIVLNYLYKSKLTKILVCLTIGKIYKQKIFKNKLKMKFLQNGIYKKHFDFINQ